MSRTAVKINVLKATWIWNPFHLIKFLATKLLYKQLNEWTKDFLLFYYKFNLKPDLYKEAISVETILKLFSVFSVYIPLWWQDLGLRFSCNNLNPCY